MKQQIKIFIIAFLTINIMVTQVSKYEAWAYPTNYVLNMTKYQQEKKNWCWAATSQMISSFLGYKMSQTDIVTFFLGSPADKMTSTVGMTNALSYSIRSSYEVNANAVLTHTKIKKYIYNRLPLAMGIKGDNGHIVAVKGYGSGTVILMDPGRNESVTNCTYNALVNGYTDQYGPAKYTTTWTLD